MKVPSSSSGPLGPKRKALCIGLQYSDHSEPDFRLGPGAHKDAKDVANFLTKYGFEVTIMLDNYAEDSPFLPTKKNVCREIEKICSEARSGDKLFFYYSGHGAQIENLDGKELDKLDEILLLHGYVENKGFKGEHCRNRYEMDTILMDDELYAMFTKLPSGCLLTAICDNCRSGTVFDLPYTGGLFGPAGVFSCVQDENGRMNLGKFEEQPNILLLSACDDSQNTFESTSGGYFTRAFLRYMQEHGASTIEQLFSYLHHRTREDTKCEAEKENLNVTIPSPRYSFFSQPGTNDSFAGRL